VKKIVFAVVAVGIMGVNAFASPYVRTKAQIYSDETSSEANIANNFNVPIYCKGKVYGITKSGHYVYADINKLIYPGEYATFHVYTNMFNPFNSVKDRIFCRKIDSPADELSINIQK